MNPPTTFACLATTLIAASCDRAPPVPADASQLSAAPPPPSAPRREPPSASAHPPDNTLKIVGADGTVLAEFATLTSNFTDDEGLPPRAQCRPDQVAWLAGGKAARAGIVLCLSEESSGGPVPAVVSVTEARSVIHAWWEGSGTVRVTVEGTRITVDGTIALSQFTQPASFMGGVPDQLAHIHGAAKLTF